MSHHRREPEPRRTTALAPRLPATLATPLTWPTRAHRMLGAGVPKAVIAADEAASTEARMRT